MFNSINQMKMSVQERCPSGLRSTIGNRVSVERRIVGSNPTLSVTERRVHSMGEKGVSCIIMVQKRL